MPKKVSAKHLQINKSQTVIAVSAALAAFLLVTAAVTGKSLVDQIIYNNKIISAKKDAVKQLNTNVQTTEQLVNSYKAFVGTTQNIIGGNPQGTGPRDGDNAKIVLNALPSKYDFPALTASIEKLVTGQNLQITSITGSDDEVAQSANESSPAPTPVEIPYEFAVNGNYGNIRTLIESFGKSIRPFKFNTLQLSGSQDEMTLTVNGNTYYQPAKNFNITKKAVK